MEKTTITLRENVVSDDVVHIAPEGYKFSNGYIAVLEYNTFANEWSDKKHYKYFRKMTTLEKYIDKNYKDFTDEFSLYDFLIN